MPRYDFKCRKCEYVFEAIVPFNLLTLPCVACNTPDKFSLAQNIADRQLSTPAQIHIH